MIEDRERPPAPASGPLSPRGRVVSISIRGFHRRPTPKPSGRLDLYERIVARLTSSVWLPVDAVLLPGGFLRLDDPIGHLDGAGRAKALLRRPAVLALNAIGADLPGSPVLVVGIDFKPLNRRIGGDQFVSAWQHGRLVGLARKTFPANGDTDGRGPVYPVYEQDFADPSRVITLPSGMRALLLGCYDAFGARGTVSQRFVDLSGIRALGGPYGAVRLATSSDRRALLGEWQRMMAATPCDLALVAVHNFLRPGADGYWQRHGIAGASSALGVPVIGASHFNEALPVEPPTSVLAAADVPAGHLDEGPNRRPHKLLPVDHWTLDGPDGEPVALARLFSLSRATSP
jgi:hypothetical protein